MNQKKAFVIGCKDGARDEVASEILRLLELEIPSTPQHPILVRVEIITPTEEEG